MKARNGFGNYALYNEDKFMCFVSYSKIQFYLKNNLIEEIDENKFKLLFKPKGKGLVNIIPEEYISIKKNECCKCGENDLDCLTKHHIIPYTVFKYFSLEEKRYYEPILIMLCATCHSDFHQKNDKNFWIIVEDKLQLNELFNNIKKETDELKLKGSALGSLKALYKFKHKIPKEKIEKLETQIKEIFPFLNLENPKEIE